MSRLLPDGDVRETAAVGRPSPMEPDPRVTSRADALLPEEQRAGAGDAVRQAEVILEESDARQNDRDAAPGSSVEHRTSEDTTPPPD